jgi:hypothetical protein
MGGEHGDYVDEPVVVLTADERQRRDAAYEWRVMNTTTKLKYDNVMYELGQLVDFMLDEEEVGETLTQVVRGNYVCLDCSSICARGAECMECANDGDDDGECDGECECCTDDDDDCIECYVDSDTDDE